MHSSLYFINSNQFKCKLVTEITLLLLATAVSLSLVYITPQVEGQEPDGSYKNETWGSWYKPAPDQKGGNVTANFHANIEYTNATNRAIDLKIIINLDKELIERMYNKNDIHFTVYATGNKLYHKEILPLNILNYDNIIEIPLTDGRLDDYRVCLWFDNYDRDGKCINYSNRLNITSQHVDMTTSLKYVNDDIEDERNSPDDERINLSPTNTQNKES